jgi:hypothetical protein
MNQHGGKRQGHHRKYRSGLQPSRPSQPITWGFAPCWYRLRPRRTHSASLPKGKQACSTHS